jgi:hypothetical protein
MIFSCIDTITNSLRIDSVWWEYCILDRRWDDGSQAVSLGFVISDLISIFLIFSDSAIISLLHSIIVDYDPIQNSSLITIQYMTVSKLMLI